MKLIRPRPACAQAFTLVEMMISVTMGGLILGAMVLGFGALQRGSAATDEYYQATSDQMRVLDSIALDMRLAIVNATPNTIPNTMNGVPPHVIGTVSNSAHTLTLILPDYIDDSQDPPTPRTPIIAASGTVTYGSTPTSTPSYGITPTPTPAPTPPPTVVYTIAPNQTITRTYTPTSGSATTTTLTRAAADYEFNCFDPKKFSPFVPNTFFDPTNPPPDFPFGGAGQPSSITARITFMPKYNRLKRASSREGTAASATILLRNHL
jgi:type II secretory pathway pseudopilin PulG